MFSNGGGRWWDIGWIFTFYDGDIYDRLVQSMEKQSNPTLKHCTDVTKLHLHRPIENSGQSLPTNKMKFQKYMLMKTR